MLTRRYSYDERSVAMSKVRIADRFLNEIEDRLKVINGDNFEAQELRSAQKTFKTEKELALSALHYLPIPRLSPDEEKRRQRNEVIEASTVADKCLFVERLRAMGDFRQMKIHMLSTLRIRHQIEKEAAL